MGARAPTAPTSLAPLYIRFKGIIYYRETEQRVDYRKIAMMKRYFMNEKVRQKVIMSSPIFIIFCYFLESFDTSILNESQNKPNL